MLSGCGAGADQPGLWAALGVRPVPGSFGLGVLGGGFGEGLAGARSGGGGAVLVELEQVVGEVHERPFALGGWEAAAAEAAHAAVVFALGEDRLDGAGALGVGGGAFGGAEPVLHRVGRAGVGGRRAAGVAELAGEAALLVVFDGGDQALGAGGGGVGVA